VPGWTSAHAVAAGAATFANLQAKSAKLRRVMMLPTIAQKKNKSTLAPVTACRLLAFWFMQAKLIDPDGKTFAVIFSTGEDPVAGLTRFAAEQKIGAASFTAIGAFSEAELGYFDWEKKDYERIPVREQVEVLSLLGDIALDASSPPACALRSK
jgi:hypothetical protein